ncbi:Arf-GAP domain and FG repeat-containing protein 1 [Porphyridium purpureum]|uniref:Arf-GAP domain and FG repeat-containing protein 1 n=1 Tax=Porphyridium purpureum TaxID=35688 RepID=A0A5J4Z8V6_PORPP|nr:Arf-GAP domain and FG repeat-containing protein 1 [Porphyridium purpureum]|eukprot:POR3280..scf295_1
MARIAEHEEAERLIRGMTRLEENAHCADCGARDPTFVNLTIGTFVCSVCADEHKDARRRVKNIETATFMMEDAEFLEARGNAVANMHYLAKWNPREFPEPKPGDRAAIKEFLWLKYDGSWASKEGMRPKPVGGAGPGYDTVRGAGGGYDNYATARGGGGYGPYPSVRGGGYDTYRGGGYDTYRGAPPHSSYRSDSDDDKRKKSGKSKKKKKSSKARSHDDSEGEDDFPQADQLKLMFGEVSVIQTPMGWRVMTPQGMMFPQVAYQMGFAKMSQPQAQMVLKRQALIKKQQKLQAEQMIKREAAMKEQEAALLKQQAKLVKQGNIPAAVAMNQVRARQQMVNQMNRNAMNAQMNTMGMGAMASMGAAGAMHMPYMALPHGGAMPGQAYGMPSASPAYQQQHPQNMMHQAGQQGHGQAMLQLPAPPAHFSSSGGPPSQSGMGLAGSQATVQPPSSRGSGEGLLGGMAGGLDASQFMNPMSAPALASNGTVPPGGDFVQPEDPFGGGVGGLAPSGMPLAGASLAMGTVEDNPFADFGNLTVGGGAQGAEGGFDGDNPFG